MAELTLVIGNKNYSSWSMRPWVLMRELGIAFDEVRLPFHSREWDAAIERWSPSRLVPVLWRDAQSVWDSLAIMETLHEWHPDRGVWPRDPLARARARSAAAEMHAGFRNLRARMPMNIRASHPGKGLTPEVRAEIDRIERLWEESRAAIRVGRPVPVRVLLRGRRDVRAGRDAFPDLCPRPSAGERALLRGHARGARRARLGGRGAARAGVRRRGRAVRRARRRMKVYSVGGAVRDELLGLPVQDRDCVVVGADRSEMAALGYRPVGNDFPVFLHPHTHEEYALARTERKTAPGYKGFAFHASPDVTLEEDLAAPRLHHQCDRAGAGRHPDRSLRRAADLKAGVLRHVSEAFAEDPVRILRVARFAARFGFAVAPETMALMRRMVAQGEVDALVPERVWQELARGLMEPAPARMIAVLRECGAAARILPELDRALAQPGAPERLAARLEHAAARGRVLAVRYALLVLDLPAGEAEALASRVNAPGECRSLAALALRERASAANAPDAEASLALLERADALRRPERLERLLEVAESDALAPDPAAFAPRRALLDALAAARGIDAGAAARESPADIPGAVRRARLAAIAALRPGGRH